jgi:hypothetical protein
LSQDNFWGNVSQGGYYANLEYKFNNKFKMGFAGSYLNSRVRISENSLLGITTNQIINNNNYLGLLHATVAIKKLYLKPSIAYSNLNYLSEKQDQLQVGGEVLFDLKNDERLVFGLGLYHFTNNSNVSTFYKPSISFAVSDEVYISADYFYTNQVNYSDQNGFVIYNSTIYKARRAVPVSTSISDTTYWAESNWLELYADAINTAAEPNSIGLIEIPNAQALVSNGYLTISVLNSDAAVPFTQLTVLPGLGNAFYDIGFETQYYAQTIQAPGQLAYSHFGAALDISDDSLTLIVGAPQGTAFKPTTFDGGATYFDSKATEYFDPLNESGVAYTYDLLSAANGSIYNPSKFVFGQQIYDETLSSLDEFGTAVQFIPSYE